MNDVIRYSLTSKITTIEEFPFSKGVWEAKAEVYPFSYPVTIAATDEFQVGAAAKLTLVLRRLGINGEMRVTNVS